MTQLKTNEVVNELIGKICKQGRAIKMHSTNLENRLDDPFYSPYDVIPTCEYIVTDKDGKTRYCIHSLAVKPKFRQTCLGGSASSNIGTHGGDSIHQERYQGHSKDFWDQMQKLHDGDCYWVTNTKDGSLKLSKHGIAERDRIIKAYS